MKIAALAAASGVIFLPLAAAAQPPQGSLPLSQIIQSIEESEDVAYFDEIEWDSDGYWEIEYYRADGAKVEIDIDPVSGAAR